MFCVYNPQLLEMRYLVIKSEGRLRTSVVALHKHTRVHIQCWMCIFTMELYLIFHSAANAACYTFQSHMSANMRCVEGKNPQKKVKLVFATIEKNVAHKKIWEIHTTSSSDFKLYITTRWCWNSNDLRFLLVQKFNKKDRHNFFLQLFPSLHSLRHRKSV